MTRSAKFQESADWFSYLQKKKKKKSFLESSRHGYGAVLKKVQEGKKGKIKSSSLHPAGLIALHSYCDDLFINVHFMAQL